MKHNERCENANPKGKCTCGCGGALHGINRMDNHGVSDERTITERLGGEIEPILKELHGKVFTCSCKQRITIGAWLGYPHEGGLADKDGKKWWVYIECPKCEYDWSWHKIPIEVNRHQLNQKEKECRKLKMKNIALSFR